MWRTALARADSTRQVRLLLELPFEIRGGVWPGKNHKYFKKSNLDIEFQILFLFDILLQKIHSDIKMLYNFVNNNMHKMFRQGKTYLKKIITCILAQNVQVLTFAF